MIPYGNGHPMFWIWRSKAAAVRKAGMAKPVTSDPFRHCLATHGLKNGYDLRTMPEGLGHQGVQTARIGPPYRIEEVGDGRLILPPTRQTHSVMNAGAQTGLEEIKITFFTGMRLYET